LTSLALRQNHNQSIVLHGFCLHCGTTIAGLGNLAAGLPAKAALVANDDLQNRLSRTIPDNLSGLAWHIRGITALAIALKVVGAGIRLGGFN
jgi:hypothetical protein